LSKFVALKLIFCLKNRKKALENGVFTQNLHNLVGYSLIFAKFCSML